MSATSGTPSLSVSDTSYSLLDPKYLHKVSDRAATGVFVKPHPKLSDLPLDSVPTTDHESKHVLVVVGKRRRTKSTDTSQSLKTVASSSAPNTIPIMIEKSVVVVYHSEGLSPPTSSSSLELSDTPSEESDPSLFEEGRASPKKKKWTRSLFSRSNSARKLKYSLENREGNATTTVSAPATPLPTVPVLKEHQQTQTSGSASVPSSPRVHSSQKVLKKVPPPHLHLNLKSDDHPSKLHLSPADLSKVNAYFAYGPGDAVVTPGSGSRIALHTPTTTPPTAKKTPFFPTTPRTPGGSVVPPHLFTPGHLVDREAFLEQVQRRQKSGNGSADIIDPLLARHNRPLSLVPELTESLDEEDVLCNDNDDIRGEVSDVVKRYSSHEIIGYTVEAALAMIYPDMPIEDLEAIPDLDGTMSHHYEESSCVYFTVDPDWEPSDCAEAECYFVEDPFSDDRKRDWRNADAFTKFNDGFEKRP
ncbi:hypothetical protein PQX77_000685 [Marasmius sp. AFHP31]|nr:hypothetical protein PQX77_011050 [Marasmius sp. AFHP31]KAK1236095.1 hypothetical protein PQX77_000685 [Marasmius sp. AFHP31]